MHFDVCTIAVYICSVYTGNKQLHIMNGLPIYVIKLVVKGTFCIQLSGPGYLTDLSNSRVCCSQFALGNPKCLSNVMKISAKTSCHFHGLDAGSITVLIRNYPS